MGGSREKFSAFSKFSFEYLNFISEQMANKKSRIYKYIFQILH